MSENLFLCVKDDRGYQRFYILIFRIFYKERMDTEENFSICTSISALSLLKKYSLNSMPLLKKLQREYQDFSFDLKSIENNSSIYLLSKIKKQFDCYELMIVGTCNIIQNLMSIVKFWRLRIWENFS